MQGMNTIVISIILIVIGLIHLAPGLGVLGVRYLDDLYGISVGEANIQILMRHRAVLFAILGSLILYSVWQPELRLLALFMALISTLSFCLLCWHVGDYNGQLQRVLWIDIAAAIAALIAIWMTFSTR